MERIETRIQKKRRHLSLIDMLVVLYMTHKLLPAVGQLMPSVAYLAVFAGITVLLATAKHNVMTGTRFFLLVFSFAISIASLLYVAMTSTLNDFALNLYGELQIFLYGWIAVWYIERTDKKKISGAFFLIAICYAVTAISTYIGCTFYPGASRLMATLKATDTQFIRLASLNIGSFSFIYELVLVAPLLIYFAKTKRIHPLASVIAFVALTLIILKTEYTTALMIFLISMVLFLMKKLTAKKIVVLLVVALLILFVFAGIIAEFLDWFADIVPSDTLGARFKYISATLRGEELGDTTTSGDRLAIYEKSLNIIAKTNLMGNWSKEGISGHSLIFDTIAQYGLVGILIIMTMYSAVYRLALYPNRKKDYYPYLLWIFFVAILLAVLNPKTNLFIFICVVPLFSAVVDNGKGEDDEIAVDSK